MREILFGTGLGVMMALAMVLAAAWPAPDSPVAALFPRHDAPEALAAVTAADGQLLDVIGRMKWIISTSERRDYVSSLYGLGAWLVIDARMAQLCFGRETKTDA